MSISIAMATFNGGRFVREQLDSIAAQTRLPDELVVTDDGSTDDTVAVLREFAHRAPFPVRIHCNERNLGYTHNFLRAATLCTSEWIAFCDQDDVWLPEKLAIVERSMTPGGHMLIAHTAELVDKFLVRSGVRYPRMGRYRVCRRGQLPTWWLVEGFVMTFRAELVTLFAGLVADAFGERPFPRGHDAMISRLARVLGEVVMLPECLALHRWHESAVTSGSLSSDARGIRRASGLLSRVRRVMHAHGGGAHAQQVWEARDQAAQFRMLAQREDLTHWRSQFRAAEREFTAFADWTAVRARLYEVSSRRRRVGLLCRLLLSGGYLRFSGRSLIGARALAKDVFLDVSATLARGSHLRRADLQESGTQWPGGRS